MRETLQSVEQTLHEEHEKAVIAKEKLSAEVALSAKAASEYKEKHKELKKHQIGSERNNSL